MKEVKIRKVNFYKEKYYNKYNFNVWENGHIIYSNGIKVEYQKIDHMIKYTAFIRQHKGCMISTSLFVEENKYNIDDVIKYLGYYLICNRLRIKYEKLQGRLNSFKQLSRYIYKYENKRDIEKLERIIGTIKNYMSSVNELMRLFNYYIVGYDIINKFSEGHKQKFYLNK